MSLVAQLKASLTGNSEVPGFDAPVLHHSFIETDLGHSLHSADSRRAVVNYWPKCVVNQLVGLSLPGKCVVRLAHSPNMTIAVYRGH